MNTTYVNAFKKIKIVFLIIFAYLLIIDNLSEICQSNKKKILNLNNVKSTSDNNISASNE